MHLYWDLMFPRMCDLAMRTTKFATQRAALLAHAQGDVIEIGAGSGLNLKHYPNKVQRVTTIDPSSGMSRLLRKRVQESGRAVDHHIMPAEEIEFANESFDCAVTTWTLCSVQNAERVVAQLYRVLKPGGKLLFLEHGLSDVANVRTWQRRLNPFHRRIAGCVLDLNVPRLLEHAPFASLKIENFCLDRVPRTHGTMYRGIARK